MIPQYPSSLPGVAGFQMTPTPQVVSTDIDRSARATHRYTQLPGAVANLTWKFDGTDYRVFKDWWRTELLDGHRWFLISLPSANGIVPTIVRFLQHRETQNSGYKYWIVTATVEILERKIKPDVSEDFVTSTIYPIYVPEELLPTVSLTFGQLSPPVMPMDELEPSFTLVSAQLLSPLKTGYTEDSLKPTFTLLPSTLRTLLLFYDNGVEEIAPSISLLGGSLDAVLVANDIPPEGVVPSITLISGTLT